MIKIIGGININPKKTEIVKLCNTLVLIEHIGLFKERQYDLTNNIISFNKIESNTKKYTLAIKLRNTKEIILTCNLDESLLLYNVYFNTEKPKN
nr:MAG TPA: hypothetical protein [Caudoviricetes sp.]